MNGRNVNHQIRHCGGDRALNNSHLKVWQNAIQLETPCIITRKRYTFWITDVQAEGLKRVKENEGTSESEQIRQALNEWLKRKGAIETGLRRGGTRRKP